MSGNELTRLSIAEAGERIRRRALSPVELTRAYLDQIQARNADGRYYLTVLHDAALAAARTAEQEIGGGNYRGPLHGIPVALKDLVMTRGVRTTCGSRILKDWVPETDATVAARLAAAGAVLLGKLNMHEFAYGPTGVNPHYGTPSNPWGADRMPGGSSSGSGAAVAAGLCAGALGTDTGGSIRIPASLCGIVGLKPTYGRVSRAGVVPLAWSLDHIGPMTRTVADAALLLQALAGHDPADPSTAAVPVPDYRRGLDGDPRTLRVGVVRGAVLRAAGPGGPARPSRPRRGRWRVSGSMWRRFASPGSTTRGRRPSPSSPPSPWPITSRISRRAHRSTVPTSGRACSLASSSWPPST